MDELLNNYHGDIHFCVVDVVYFPIKYQIVH